VRNTPAEPDEIIPFTVITCPLPPEKLQDEKKSRTKRITVSPGLNFNTLI
jgi:hypothetical protein